MNNFEIDEIIREADKISLKSRAIIYRPSDKKIILCNYAGIYLLPGGKIDKGEDPLDAVSREVEEEVGLTFPIDSYNLSFIYSTGQRGYVERDLTKTTKALAEFIFFVNYDNLIEKKNINLTESEKKEKFTYSWVGISEAINMIRNNESENPRIPLYEGPLLDILYKIKDIFVDEKSDIIFINTITNKRNNILINHKQELIDLYGDESIIEKITSMAKEDDYLCMTVDNKIVAMIGVYMIDSDTYYIDDCALNNNYRDRGYIEELTEYARDFLDSWRSAKLINQKVLTKTSK